LVGFPFFVAGAIFFKVFERLLAFGNAKASRGFHKLRVLRHSSDYRGAPS